MSSNSRRRPVLRPRTAYTGLTSLVGAFALPKIFIAKRLVDRMPARVHAIAFIALLVVMA